DAKRTAAGIPTYSSRDSHIVTDRSTNLPLNCLCMAQLTHFRFETIALKASRFGESTNYSAATVSKRTRTANLNSGSQSAPLSDICTFTSWIPAFACQQLVEFSLRPNNVRLPVPQLLVNMNLHVSYLASSAPKNTIAMDDEDMYEDLREAVVTADSRMLDMVSIKEIVYADRFKKFKALDKEWQEHVP
ncbi:hypothetical protein KCU90_g8053, partial [Aureobasidium melanogenum]